MMRTYLGLTLSAALAIATLARADDPLILQNSQLRLIFDRQTGGWTGLVSVVTGAELVAGPAPRALVSAGPAVQLDRESVRAALARHHAVDLTDGWQYTPSPPSDEQAAAIVAGRYDGVRWDATPVSSRRGMGDDRLHGRDGTFFYRRSFAAPPLAGDLVLVIGAVDDFDTTYVNGTRVGRTDAGTPHHWEVPRFYRVPARLLRKDRLNELVIRATNAGYDGGVDGPIVLGQSAVLVPQPSAGPPLVSQKLTRRGKTGVLTMAAGAPLRTTMEVVLPDDQAWFSRRLTVTNLGAKEVTVQTEPTMATPPLCVGPRQAFAFPGSLPVGDGPVASLGEGEAQTSRSLDPLAILWDATTGRGLGTWYHCEEEFSPVSVTRRGEGGVVIRHAQQIIVRLAPGESVSLGRQFFWLALGQRDQVLDGVQAIYREVGLKAPAGRLPGLRSSVMYNGHPGGTPEQGFRGYGGFRELERYVPTLEQMHVDLLWLLPIWEHGDGRRWNLYAPFDHFRISPIYGTPEELKSLSQAAGKGGIRLMFDLVPHGPPDFTPLAKEHPEWITLDPTGKLQYAWGQYAFDNAHPGWQAYMRRAAAWDAREFAAVGARVDCGAGGAPNYNRAVTSRPSLSTLAAGLGMNQAIRDGYREGGRTAVVLPEEYTGANIFNKVADLTYDAQLYFLLSDLHERKASPAAWAGQLTQFLRDQQRTLPPGALKMRWISNHDTVSWTFQKNRPLVLYGVDRMRALLALCAYVEGVPMLYQGDEDPSIYGRPGPSSVAFLAKVYGLRKSLPALREGPCEYGAVPGSAEHGVVSIRRKSGDQSAVVLVSFNTVPVMLQNVGEGTWRDALSGETIDLGAAGVSLRAHQVRVLVRP